MDSGIKVSVVVQNNALLKNIAIPCHDKIVVVQKNKDVFMFENIESPKKRVLSHQDLDLTHIMKNFFTDK